VPFSTYDHPAFQRNPCLKLVAVDHGGHLGFIARRRPRFWLDGFVLDWLQQIQNKAPAGLVS
jgi:predicted alpha/beta-fold hydrolase